MDADRSTHDEPIIDNPAGITTDQVHGSATVHPPGSIPVPEDLAPMLPAERRSDCSIVEIVPEGRFLTYGIGVPLLRMRDTAAARGHAPVAGP